MLIQTIKKIKTFKSILLYTILNFNTLVVSATVATLFQSFLRLSQSLSRALFPVFLNSSVSVLIHISINLQRGAKKYIYIYIGYRWGTLTDKKVKQKNK